MENNSHAILSQQEIDNLIAQLAKATEKSYNEGFSAANEAIASSGENLDYTTGYNQGVKIGYERGVSDAWNIITKLLNQGSDELDKLLKQSSLGI